MEQLEEGGRLIRFDYEGIFLETLERLGKMPLPPYIKEELQDQERYQTVYSKVLGSAEQVAQVLGPPGAAGEDPGQGRKDRVCDAPCGPGHLPAREGGHH